MFFPFELLINQNKTSSPEDFKFMRYDCIFLYLPVVILQGVDISSDPVKKALENLRQRLTTTKEPLLGITYFISVALLLIIVHYN